MGHGRRHLGILKVAHTLMLTRYAIPTKDSGSLGKRYPLV